MNKLCQLPYLENRRIGSIRQYRSFEAIETALSRLDYCNALLNKIQGVINCSVASSAKLLNLLTSLLYDLQRLPISSRIQYKIALIRFHIVSGTVPPHLSELLHLYSLSRSLRSASDTQIFCVPRKDGRTPGEEILSIHQTCDLELSSPLCQAFFVTIFFKSN